MKSLMGGGVSGDRKSLRQAQMYVDSGRGARDALPLHGAHAPARLNR